MRRAVVPKHTVTAVAAVFFSWKVTNNAIVSEKCFLLPLYSEVFLSHIVRCRAGVKTLFKLSFNPTPTPTHYHLTFRVCILSPWWKGHTLKGRMDSLSPFLSTFVFLKRFSWSLKVTFYVIFPLPYLFQFAKQWQHERQYGCSLSKSCSGDDWLLYKWLCTHVENIKIY